MDSDELNIPSTIKDPHYRYKMPKIQVVSQGSGNGIKTKWLNLPEVTNALKVPIEYPLKFIGKELGSNTEIKANTYLINGNHTVEKMQEVLDKFIKKYVLCPKCKLPEIHGKISIKKEKGEIRCLCRSCGTLSKLDSTHDFASYIKRSPPPYEEDSKEGGSGVSQKKDGRKTFDAKMKTKIKTTVGAIAKGIAGKENEKEIIEIIQKLLNEASFPNDIKFYVFANGVFDDKIYTKNLICRLPVIKHFINNESDKKSEEALYFFIVGLWDYLFSRQKGDNAKYLSSLLYYLYNDDIITEEFWMNFAIKKSIKYNSLLYNPEVEKKFLTAAAEFTKWIETGPYEGDEEKKEEEKKEEEKKEEEEIDIDNI